MTCPRPRPGFTLPELLVVFAIIAVLMGLILPAVQGLREAGNRTICQNNLRQLNYALQQHHEQFGRMPPYASTLNSNTIASWYYFLMPYLDQTRTERANFHGSLMGGSQIWGCACRLACSQVVPDFWAPMPRKSGNI